MQKPKPNRIYLFGLKLQALFFLCAASLIHADEDPQAHYVRTTKYSPLVQINQQNVGNLEQAWVFHTGDEPPVDKKSKLVAFEDRPSIIDGNLIVCSIKRRIFAIDPATGVQRWVYDPTNAANEKDVSIEKCRGIGHWVDQEVPAGTACKSRILLGTQDYRLVAIDAQNGKPCEEFGNHGQVKIPVSKPEMIPGEVIATSDPAVVNDTVVVGSAVIDNQRVEAPSGRVMAYSARSGEFLWQFDPVPRDPNDAAMKTWPEGTERFGQGNVWSSMAVDNALDMVYLPTTSASSDFYGGGHPGDNLYTTSVVALKGSTGEVVWSFQVVHHNVFDYDLPTEPMLIDYPHEGKLVPALVQNTKMGLVFVFDRVTGEPLVPVEERPVPQQGKVEGEVLAPTQPFPVGMPSLNKLGFSPDDAWGFTFIDRWLCRREIEKLNYGPIYTPPSTKGTIFSPAASGGPNWGGGAYDPNSHIMVVPTNRVPLVITLIPRDQVKGKVEGAKIEGLSMTFDVKGMPYLPKIAPLLSPLGVPCSEPPWAALTAIDIVNKKILWDVPLGSIEKLAPIPIPWEPGTPGAGGPLITAGGLVFIGYSLDNKIRAFDLNTGNVVWSAELPAAGIGVPVTYQVNGEQYIVIPAGGHSMYGSDMGDAVVAYKLKN